MAYETIDFMTSSKNTKGGLSVHKRKLSIPNIEDMRNQNQEKDQEREPAQNQGKKVMQVGGRE